MEKVKETYAKLGEALKALGHKLDERGSVDGLVHVRVEQELSGHGRYGRKPTGKVRIKYGVGYRSRSNQFPEPNAGFDFARIAQKLAAIADYQKAVEADRRRISKRGAANESARRRLNDMDVAGVWVTINGNGDLQVEAKVPCSEAQAEELMRAIRAIRAGSSE